jgi:pyruvate,water dikinase
MTKEKLMFDNRPPKPDAILALDADGATLALVGGKGANLAKLARAGFPVPDGFLLTTQAYRDFVVSNGLAARIDSVIAQTQPDDPAALEQASSQLRAAFAQGVIPDHLAVAIGRAYVALGQPPVAVRSSATAEDLPDMSFAGQQDTYLNILGETALLDAVIRCWGSLWTARAIGYRSRNSIAHSQVELSVVVQAMVQSEASGVLFTANPLTGKRSETVIDATLGLGEALVSGQVEPDHYVVSTASGQILNKTLGAKALTIRSQTGGGTVTVNADAARQQALPDAVIGELAALGRRVADFYGTPQDIEWGWARGQLYLLQARPITSLFPLPAGVDPDSLEIFFSFGAIQGMLDPMTPLGRDAIQGLAAGGAQLFGFPVTITTQQVGKSAGERLWVQPTPLVRNRIGRQAIQKMLSVIEPSIAQALTQVMDEPGLAVGGLPTLATLRRLARFFVPVAGRVALLLWRPEQNRVALVRQIDDVVAQIAAQAQATATLAERLALFEATLYQLVPLARRYLIPPVLSGLLMMNRLLALARRVWGDNQRHTLEITRGLPHNVTTEMDLALWTTAQRIRRDPATLATLLSADAAALAARYLAGALPPLAQQAVADFLARYGMRGLAEIDLGRRRWHDDPIQVMQTLQSYLRIDDPNQAPDVVFQRGEAAAQAAIAELVATLEATPGQALQARLARWMATRMRSWAGWRESPKFFIIRVFGILRRMLLASGAELVEAGKLAQAEDVVFLHLAELQALAAGYAIDWQALVAERRALYEREKLRRQVPRLLLSDGRAFYGSSQVHAQDREGVLVGSPVSPGVVEGIVHVVFDPHITQLAPGEILVCPGTDPAWTPLFLAAGGLVMEVGGLMTHGSVVAREYGIPAVVGVHEVTSRLKSGQRVRVDGASGEVIVLN